MFKLGYCNDCDQYGIVGYMACRRQNLCPSCVADDQNIPVEVAYAEALSDVLTTMIAKKIEEMTALKVEGRINPDTGNSELLVNGVQKGESYNYHAPAMWMDGRNERLYLVFSHYWEGCLPQDFIGVALRATKV